jgi:hypothetical protein
MSELIKAILNRDLTTLTKILETQNKEKEDAKNQNKK